jgi:ABC-type transport system involved in cytochrome c biogenesis permease subunit
MNPILTPISLLIYAIAALLYLIQLVFQKRTFLVFGQRLVILAFLLQGIGFAIHIAQVGYPFLLDSSDSYLFSAWVLAGLFILICLKYRFQVAGALFLPAILVLYTLAHFSQENYLGNTGLANSPWASIHIVFGFLSFSIFFLSFILGVLFLFQELQLKRKKIWRIFDKLPSLDVLDQLHYKALSVGFVLLSLGIITGAAWAKSVKGVYFFDDPRQLWSIIAWLVYAFFFQVRFSAGWKGRRGVLLSLMGFMVILFTFLEVRHV